MILAHLTAITRSGPSLPLRRFLQENTLAARTRVLDFGCGRGADVAFLHDLGHRVEGFDPHYCPSCPTGKFPLVICNFVLNVMDLAEERAAVLRRLRQYCSGRLLIATRSKTQVDRLAESGGWIRHCDGYLTPKQTFQRGFEPASLTQMLNKAGFVVTRSFAIKDAVCLLATIGECQTWQTCA